MKDSVEHQSTIWILHNGILISEIKVIFFNFQNKNNILYIITKILKSFSQMCFSVSQIMLYDVQQLKYQEQSCIIILVAELLYPITQSQNNRNWTKRDLTGLI